MNINALTYNISWATQQNITAGSEKNFVTACQANYGKKGGRVCYENGLRKISEHCRNNNLVFHVIGLQELVEIDGVDFFTHFKKYSQLDNLTDCFIKKVPGKNKLEKAGLLWDRNKLGIKVKGTVFNLNYHTYDDRACVCVILKKNNIYTILISLHASGDEKRITKNGKTIVLNRNQSISSQENLINFFNKNKDIVKRKDTNIIILGDFNDFKVDISNDNPFKITLDDGTDITLTTGFNKKYHKRNLRSCCYNSTTIEQRNKTMKSRRNAVRKARRNGTHYSFNIDSANNFKLNADIILGNKNVNMKRLYIPDEFKYDNPNKYPVNEKNSLASDHLPVAGVLKIKHNINITKKNNN